MQIKFCVFCFRMNAKVKLFHFRLPGGFMPLTSPVQIFCALGIFTSRLSLFPCTGKTWLTSAACLLSVFWKSYCFTVSYSVTIIGAVSTVERKLSFSHPESFCGIRCGYLFTQQSLGRDICLKDILKDDSPCSHFEKLIRCPVLQWLSKKKKKKH